MMKRPSIGRTFAGAAVTSFLLAAAVACSDDGDDEPIDGGSGGSHVSGTGGQGGHSGDGGQAGDGTGGVETGGTGGNAGEPTAGVDGGGQAGSEGGAGTGGAAGLGGKSGNGPIAGSGGAQSGSGGASGAAGSGGSGGIPPCEEYPDGAPGAGCACIRVTPDGDDAAAGADGAATPFRNVQPAIDYASAHPTVANNVCVALGSACGQSADYPGPVTGFALRDGVSVYGDYESTGWTRCDLGTTRLLPSTAAGVSADVGVESATLDGFSIQPAAVDGARGITVSGAGEVVLSDLQIKAPPSALDFVAIDVSGGAVARLSTVSVATPGIDPPVLGRGVSIALRVVDSRLVADQVDVRLNGDADAEMYAVWLERASLSTISNSILRLERGGHLVAGHVVGGDALDVTSSRFVAGDSGVIDTATGFLLRDGASVTLTDTVVYAANAAQKLALDVLGARVTMLGTSQTDGAVLLEDAPGSRVTGVRGSSDPIGAAVVVRGDGEEVVVGDVIASASGPDVVGVKFEDCAGAAPLVTGTIAMTGTGDHVAAVRSRGNCHPRIEDSTITTTGHESTVVRGVRCDAERGVPSRCSVTRSTLRARLFPSSSSPTTFLGNHYGIGVSCSGGSCTTVSDNRFEFDQVFGSCGRSCTAHAYGVATDATVSVANNVIETSITGQPVTTLCVITFPPGPEATLPCWDTAVQLFYYSPCDPGYVSDGDFAIFGGCVVP